MKIRLQVNFGFILLLITILLLHGQVQAQPPVPAWVTTAAPQLGMLPPGSTFEKGVYDASQMMMPRTWHFEIGGYWTNADNTPLYYVTANENPATFFLFNRGDVPGG